MAAVRALTADFPQNTFYCKRLSRDEIKSLMEQCTCLVCASRDDPMPTFVTEGLIFGKPSIVSEHTGTAGLITEGVNGFVYPNDDPAELAKRLEWAIEHPEKLASMRTDCRKLYEQYYSKEAFARPWPKRVSTVESTSPAPLRGSFFVVFCLFYPFCNLFFIIPSHLTEKIIRLFTNMRHRCAILLFKQPGRDSSGFRRVERSVFSPWFSPPLPSSPPAERRFFRWWCCWR